MLAGVFFILAETVLYEIQSMDFFALEQVSYMRKIAYEPSK